MNDMSLNNQFQKKAAVKIVIIALLLIVNVNLIIDAAESFNEDITWGSDSRRFSTYDRYLSEGDYNGLRTSMLLNKSYDSVFDSYWEIADAYELLSEYKVWQRALGEPDLQDGSYEEQMRENKDQLMELCINSRFDKNKSILESFEKQID